MGWFSFGGGSNTPKTSNTPLPPQQIEQRSHESMNLPKNSDIATTLNQLSSQTEDNKEVKIQELSNNTNIKDTQKSIDNFVESYPISNMFVIDGEKDSKDCIICTSNADGGKTCLKLKINSIELFKIMQKKEYFCSLPDAIDATYFECRKIQ